MPDFTKAGYQGTWIPQRRLSGEHGLTIVVKRRFLVDLASAECTPEEEQPPIVLGPEFRDPENAAQSDIVEPSEIAPEKARCDIIVKATAYAPGGKATPEFEVGIRLSGGFERTLTVIGNRVVRYAAPKKKLTKKQKNAGERQEYPPPKFSKPKPLDKLPLTYAYAYGGLGKIVMEDDIAELAEEFQEEAKELEKRKERKKEIEEELLAEEEAKEQAAIEAKKPAPAIADEGAAEKADEAFAGPGGTQMISLEALAEQEAADAEPDLKKVSEFRLGKDLPERPEDETEDAQADEEDGEPPAGADGTQILDISELDDIKDEYKETLDDKAAQRARKLKDKEGALRSRATEFGDIELTDDEWVDEHGERPEEAPEEEEEPSEYPEIPYPANPIGRGFCVGPLKEAVHGLKLPNIEWPDARITPETLIQDLEEFDLHELEPPAGFAAYPMSWFPRAGLSGVLPWDLDDAEAAKLKALEAFDEDDPEDQPAIELIKEQAVPVMQQAFYQEAHPRMQVERVNGNEEILLTNLTPDGTLFFKLPGTHPKVTVERPLHSDPVPIQLDMLTLDVDNPDQPAVELVWRGWYALTDFAQIEEISPFDIDIDSVDQDAWFDLQRDFDTHKDKPRAEGTQVFKAIDEDDPEQALSRAEVDARYKDWVERRKAQELEEVGEPEADGTKVFDQGRDIQLTEDEWDDSIRDNKEAFVAEAAERKAAEKAARRKAIRKKAREKADEEFGIEREEPPPEEDT